MAYTYESYATTLEQHDLYDRLYEELPSDMGRLAIASVTAGMFDVPQAAAHEKSAPVESLKNDAENDEMTILFRKVLGEVTFRRLEMDEAAVFEGRAAA